MRNTTLSCLLGAMLMLSVAPVTIGAAKAASAQTSTKKSTKRKKGKTTSKSKKKSRISGQKAPAPDRIKDIQTALQREGAYQGEPNGKWDDSTADAMKRYQDKNGLNSTGKIDAPTLNKLGLGSDTAGKGAPVPTMSSTSSSDLRAK